MKQLSCRAMGADCDYVATGNNEQAVFDDMMNHAKDEHPDKWAEMEQMSDDEKNKMMKDARAKMEDVDEEL